MTATAKQVIIHIETTGKNFSTINYSRRMYAILRRYTPNVVEGNSNECFAELTGLRTFLKMTYKEMIDSILIDLKNEIGVVFTVHLATGDEFLKAKVTGKKSKSISTYKELGKLFSSSKYGSMSSQKGLNVRKKLTVPYLGKVA